MSKPPRFLIVWLAMLIPATAVGAQSLVARKITQQSDLAHGKLAIGKPGDYILANDRIRIIIDNVGQRQGFAEGGGNIVDAARQDANIDLLSQLITYFDNTFPRQAVYERIEVRKDGSDGQEARIRVSGRELKNRNLEIATEYSLRPGEPFVLLETSVTNRGTATIRDFELGDAVQWGLTEHFAPGFGTNLSGRTLSNLGWLAGLGEGVSYGYTAKTGTLSGPNGLSWSDANVARVRLVPDVPVTYSRYFIVGSGDVASVVDQVCAIRNQTTGSLGGIVLEEPTKQPVRDASLEVRDSTDKPVNIVRPGVDGKFAARLPAGGYALRTTAPGRSMARSVSVVVEEGKSASVQVGLGKPGRLRFSVTDAIAGKPIPAKITFRGLGDTAVPSLGPAYRAAGARNVVFTGTGNGETLIPPGFYEAAVSRGIEYTTYQERVSVEAGETAVLKAKLERVVDTTGCVSADFHLHTDHSTDSNITLRDRVIGLAAEGVEFAVASDHYDMADYAGTILELGLQGELNSSIGYEVTASGTIHFNVFPLQAHAGQPEHRVRVSAGMKVQEMIDAVKSDPGDEIVQLNHPRAGNLGYFTTSQFDSARLSSPDAGFTLDFDAIEVFNGKMLAQAEEAINDWYNLLNAGYRIAATGNSDSHVLVGQESGYPRNYLLLGMDDPGAVTESAVAAAVKAHRILVTNGPFLTVRADGKHTIGDDVNAAGHPVTFVVKLQSAPWIDVAQVSLIGNGEVVASRLVYETKRVGKGTFTFTVTPARDTWYVVVARGSRSLEPVVPNPPGQLVFPLAFTNPIWVDADGDGKFTPLRPAKLKTGP